MFYHPHSNPYRTGVTCGRPESITCCLDKVPPIMSSTSSPLAFLRRKLPRYSRGFTCSQQTQVKMDISRGFTCSQQTQVKMVITAKMVISRGFTCSQQTQVKMVISSRFTCSQQTQVKMVISRGLTCSQQTQVKMVITGKNGYFQRIYLFSTDTGKNGYYCTPVFASLMQCAVLYTAICLIHSGSYQVKM